MYEIYLLKITYFPNFEYLALANHVNLLDERLYIEHQQQKITKQIILVIKTTNSIFKLYILQRFRNISVYLHA